MLDYISFHQGALQSNSKVLSLEKTNNTLITIKNHLSVNVDKFAWMPSIIDNALIERFSIIDVRT